MNGELRRFDVFPYARFLNAAAGCGQGSSFANRSSCCAVAMTGEPHHSAYVSPEQQRHFAAEHRKPARTRESSRETRVRDEPFPLKHRHNGASGTNCPQRPKETLNL